MLGKNIDLNRVIKNSSILVLSRIFGKIATTLLIIFIARQLGEHQFGILSSLLAFITLFSIIEEFGLTVPLIRSIAKRQLEPGILLGTVLAVKIPLGMVAYGLLIGFSSLFEIPLELALIWGISMFFENLTVSVTRSFEGFQEMKYVAFITVIERILLVVLGVSILISNGSLVDLGLIHALTFLCSLILGIAIFHLKFSNVSFRFDFDRCLIRLREARPFFLASLFSVVYNRTDIVFLTLYQSPAEVGWYNAAFRVIDAQMFIPAAVVGAMFPIFSEYYYSNHAKFVRTYYQSLYFLLILGIAVSLLTYLGSVPIVNILYSAQYSESIPLLRMLALMLCFYFLNLLFGNVLISAGYENLSTITIVIGAVINLLLTALLVPRFSSQGAAVARAITEILLCAVQFFFILKVIQKK